MGTAASPSQKSPTGELRLLDLVPVVAVTAAGVVLVVLAVRSLARLNPAFTAANRETLALTATLFIYLSFAAGLALALRRFPHPLAMLGVRRPSPREVVLVVVGMVPWFISIGLVSLGVAAIFNRGQPVPSNTRNIFIQVPHGPGLLLYALLVSAVAAPICEEIFFRGMIFRYLRRRWPLWLAALVSATIFGAAHLSPATSPLIVPVLAFIGLVLALVYERTGSLTNSMMLHALNNGVLTTLTYLVITR